MEFVTYNRTLITVHPLIKSYNSTFFNFVIYVSDIVVSRSTEDTCFKYIISIQNIYPQIYSFINRLSTKMSIVFSTITIAAVVLLAAGPVVATHQAWACGFGGWGGSGDVDRSSLSSPPVFSLCGCLLITLLSPASRPLSLSK